MKNNKDIFFKLGLGLQLLLIPVAFLYHFSSEANHYNWVLGGCLVLITLLFAWPQTIIVRAKRLRAIKLQFLLVILTLIISWAAYGSLYHYTRTHCSPAYQYKVENSLVIPVDPNFNPNDFGHNCDFNPSSPDVMSSYIRNDILPWYLLMNPGISLQTAGLISVLFLLFPSANYYRYSLDKKRIKGIKKTDLFA